MATRQAGFDTRKTRRLEHSDGGRVHETVRMIFIVSPKSSILIFHYHCRFIFFSNFIQVLGEQNKLRQQVIATATVYFKRFYARNSLKSIDPFLLAPTCIFLASKVEEFGVISANRLAGSCSNVIKNKFSYAYNQDYPYSSKHILECEFYLLENLDCCLIVYQPYRPLLLLIQDIGAQEEQLLTLTWRIINDSLRTDVSLLFPPHQVRSVLKFVDLNFHLHVNPILDRHWRPPDCMRDPPKRAETLVRRAQCRHGKNTGSCARRHKSL